MYLDPSQDDEEQGVHQRNIRQRSSHHFITFVSTLSHQHGVGRGTERRVCRHTGRIEGETAAFFSWLLSLLHQARINYVLTLFLRPECLFTSRASSFPVPRPPLRSTFLSLSITLHSESAASQQLVDRLYHAGGEGEPCS